MRTRWCTLILGWRNHGFAFPERDANRMDRTHSGLAKSKFCIPKTRCEPCGAHSFWVGDTKDLHSQDEMRTPRCTLTLGWRNVGFAFPEGDANLMVHAHSGLATHRFCMHKRYAKPMLYTQSSFAKPRFRIPRTRCEPYGAHSFWVGKT